MIANNSPPLYQSCPLNYRYGSAALAQCPVKPVETLYVIGGLYGNLPALDTIKAMAAKETGSVTLCFNGDFNWFNVDDEGFVATNLFVLKHDAIQGNVEAELLTPNDDAGCGCDYPENVDAVTVARSNLIHARLKSTARRHPEILDRLRVLTLFRRYQVGDSIIGVVHGDAESLAGWGFAAAALDDPANQAWIADVFRQAEVNIFASTHTCLPALRNFSPNLVIINNGAAGMPNFSEQRHGLLTRISTAAPTNNEVLYGNVQNGVHIHALPIRYDHANWVACFLANWPAGTDAWLSYFKRIEHGPPT